MNAYSTPRQKLPPQDCVVDPLRQAGHVTESVRVFVYAGWPGKLLTDSDEDESFGKRRTADHNNLASYPKCIPDPAWNLHADPCIRITELRSSWSGAQQVRERDYFESITCTCTDNQTKTTKNIIHVREKHKHNEHNQIGSSEKIKSLQDNAADRQNLD